MRAVRMRAYRAGGLQWHAAEGHTGEPAFSIDGTHDAAAGKDNYGDRRGVFKLKRVYLLAVVLRSPHLQLTDANVVRTKFIGTLLRVTSHSG